MEKIMRNTSGEPRELRDDEVDGVSGGLVWFRSSASSWARWTPALPFSVKAPAPEKHWFNGG
jgi:hypothetical protein